MAEEKIIEDIIAPVTEGEAANVAAKAKTGRAMNELKRTTREKIIADVLKLGIIDTLVDMRPGDDSIEQVLGIMTEYVDASVIPAVFDAPIAVFNKLGIETAITEEQVDDNSLVDMG